MVEEDEKVEQPKVTAGRGPAYPFIPLGKAVERAEQLRNANMARLAVAPMAIYKVWGWSGDNGNARQTMAALNHFGLIEYVGRGEERLAKLSSLAHRIVFDKVPDSRERAAALREAALIPPIYQKLWNEYQGSLPPDVVIETFLIRDQKYNDAAARNVISSFKDTIEYAGLNKPDNMPQTNLEVEEAEPMQTIPPASVPQTFERAQPPLLQSIGVPTATTENDIKVLLDGSHLRVSAFVDLKGAKRLLKALKANMALLEEDDEDTDATASEKDVFS